MAKIAKNPPLNFVRTGPAQYLHRAGILREAGECVAPWGKRALISGGRNALAAAEAPLIKSLEKAGIAWRKNLFIGECSLANIAQIKEKARGLKAQVIIGAGGGKSLDAAKQAAAELGLPAVCIPTIAATCASTTAVSAIYHDDGEFYKNLRHARNPSLVLVDPEIITRSPGIYLRAGILDSLAKWFEGRAVWPCLQNPNVQTTAAMQLAEGLYNGHRKQAVDAVRLNEAHRVDDALIQTIDRTIFLTGVIQTLGKGVHFTAIAHSIHNGLTLIKESHGVLHGLKVGYGIIVQLSVEKCAKKEFEDVLAFFRKLGLEPSFKGLGLPFEAGMVLRVAEKAVGNPEMGTLGYPVNKHILARAMERLEKRLA